MRVINSTQGFTLTELIAAVGIGSLVMLGAYSAMSMANSASDMTRAQSELATMEQEVRGILRNEADCRVNLATPNFATLEFNPTDPATVSMDFAALSNRTGHNSAEIKDYDRFRVQSLKIKNFSTLEAGQTYLAELELIGQMKVGAPLQFTRKYPLLVRTTPGTTAPLVRLASCGSTESIGMNLAQAVCESMGGLYSGLNGTCNGSRLAECPSGQFVQSIAADGSVVCANPPPPGGPTPTPAPTPPPTSFLPGKRLLCEMEIKSGTYTNVISTVEASTDGSGKPWMRWSYPHMGPMWPTDRQTAELPWTDVAVGKQWPAGRVRYQLSPTGAKMEFFSYRPTINAHQLSECAWQ